MWLSPAVILTIGAMMTIGSLFFSPETKHLELHEVGNDPTEERLRRDRHPAD